MQNHSSVRNTPASTFTSRSIHVYDDNRQSERRYVNQSSILGTPQSEWYRNTPLADVSSYQATPDIINRFEVKNSASSVVIAFRELQAKAKQIEFERVAAANEVEELRRKLADTRRNESLLKSRTEIRTTDEILIIRENSERVLKETSEIQLLLSKIQEKSQNLHRDITFQRTHLTEMNESLSRNHTETQALEYRLSQLQEDVQISNRRCDDIQKRLLSLTTSNSHFIETEHRLKTLRSKIDKENSASLKSSVRISALQKYVEVVLKINGDLTEALKSREASSSRIFRIVERHTRHMEDRDSLHYKSHSDLKQVKGNITDAEIQVKTTKSSKKKKIKNSTIMSRRLKKKRPSLEDSESDESTQQLSSLYFDEDYEKRLKKRRSQLEEDENLKVKKKTMSKVKKIKKAKVQQYEDSIDSHAAEKYLSAKNPRRSSQGTLTSISTDEIANHGREIQARASIRLSRSQSPSAWDKIPQSSRSEWLFKSQSALNNVNESERQIKVFQRPRSAPSNRGRNEKRDDNQDSTRQSRSRSRDVSLVQTASRLAATAAATAAVVAANADAAGRVGRIFVPASPCNSREFNVMASVSKAAKSARDLNATLASKVKSLDFDGSGPLFGDIAKIDLSDMHDYLTVVKNIRSSN